MSVQAGRLEGAPGIPLRIDVYKHGLDKLPTVVSNWGNKDYE